MILTTRSNAAIAAAQEYYESRYDESLVDKVPRCSLVSKQRFWLFSIVGRIRLQ